MNAFITDHGDLCCPFCRANIITPFGINPATGNLERMIVVPGTSKCPVCKKTFLVDDETANTHNEFWEGK